MERRPMALFGAIVAVGLGPALWLGAQLGTIEIAPTRPAAVVGEQDAGTGLLGGTGAGDSSTDDDNTVLQPTARANVLPLTRSPSAQPSASSSASGSPDPS